MPDSFPSAVVRIYFVDPHLRTPYTYQYNLGIQHELANKLTAEVNYVGSSSKGLTALQDINPFILGTQNRLLNLNQDAEFANFCAGQTSDCPLSSALEFRNIVFASYNSLEASLTKQVGDSRLGTTYFTLGYTYGHSIDNASGFRNRDIRYLLTRPNNSVVPRISIFVTGSHSAADGIFLSIVCGLLDPNGSSGDGVSIRS